MDNNDEYKEPHFSRILSDGVLLFIGFILYVVMFYFIFTEYR